MTDDDHASLGQLETMSAIEHRRTAAPGGHVARREDCAHARRSRNTLVVVFQARHPATPTTRFETTAHLNHPMPPPSPQPRLATSGPRPRFSPLRLVRRLPTEARHSRQCDGGRPTTLHIFRRRCHTRSMTGVGRIAVEFAMISDAPTQTHDSLD
jgi:hypothetical protein